MQLKTERPSAEAKQGRDGELADSKSKFSFVRSSAYQGSQIQQSVQGQGVTS